jgi:hypothetical protein
MIMNAKIRSRKATVVIELPHSFLKLEETTEIQMRSATPHKGERRRGDLLSESHTYKFKRYSIYYK